MRLENCLKLVLYYIVHLKRYFVYDFQMQDLSKVIFEKKGRLIIPKFENGRILVREYESNMSKIDTGLYFRQCPIDEEKEAIKVHREERPHGIGYISLSYGRGERKARCSIAIAKGDDKRNGYGTILMNAGARYGTDVGIEEIYGDMVDRPDDSHDDANIRAKFAEGQGMLISGGRVSTRILENPLLRMIEFTENKAVEDLLNSGIKRQ